MKTIIKIVKSPITWIVSAIAIVLGGIVWAFSRK